MKVLKGVNYLLPIQKRDIEEMYLMIKPSRNMTWISKKSLTYFIHSAYANVYEYGKNDLLDQIIVNLPGVIDIKELKVQITQEES